uniref:Cytochrome P450 monooxygenase 219 n=1 Tax=Postia placenta (strain ATCC 44394 / Madison 698-R) TaxID=561896 RepID=CY219_POSPM|nr:RecName: Full=Cytochrome P450 monooxygenase 219; Flags: Precursor [Postia placenta Mad-698-R]BAK09525.1 cytochrome P450 [Postia placenta]
MATLIVLLYGLLAFGTVWLVRRQSKNHDAHRVMRNIPGPPSRSWMKGNIMQYFTRHGRAFQRDVALNYGPVVRLQGPLGRKILYVSDPKALHTIIIKEENVFEEPESTLITFNLLFGDCLVGSLGENHRRQRKLLNPVFSVNHMRHMLPMFYNVIFKLREVVMAKVRGGEKEIDVLEWTGRAALELIGQGGLGYSFDPLVSDKEARNEYGDALKAMLPALMNIESLRQILPHLVKMGPKWFRRLATDIFPNAHVQTVKHVVDTMSKRSQEIFREKKAALKSGDEAVLRQVGEGKDIMSILLRANTAASDADKLPESQMVAQMSLLVFAATDTTSNTLAHILQLLAEHSNVQSKLREELLQSGAGTGNTSYDELMKLPLLDAVCRETLRVHPPATLLVRVPRKDSILPLSEPVIGLDGTIIKDVPVPEGTEIVIGVFGSNVNKSLWGEDALEWKPERWLSPLPRAVNDASIPGVYSNLMTFLGGKRACIGFKFSEMEMKVVLAVMVSNFVFELEKEIEWNVAGVDYPTVVWDGDRPQLPLKVRVYKS